MRKAETLPIVLTKPEVLIIGGGQTALLKAKNLLNNGISFQLVAPSICAEIQALGITCHKRDFQLKDLQERSLVVDATGNQEVANQLLSAKQSYAFMLNCCSDQSLSDFHFPALLNHGQLKISVSTSGASPTISKQVRDKIAKVIPAQLEELVDASKQERASGIIDPATAAEKSKQMLAQVALIGCGPGDPELLTMKAYRLIQQQDVVLYDHLLTPEIMALIPEQTEKIAVGKQKGCHSFKQEEINELIYQKALLGLNVARLKCGDPYIFGRGSEEAEYLIKRGIRVEIVSGISSALAGPACAGIPPTARGYATNLSVVSAHLAGSRINTDWFPMLKIPHHTTVVLMGLSFSRQISEIAISQGVAKNLPVAIIANASRPNQQALITDLEHLPEVATQAARPAILVFGDVVNLHQILSQPEEFFYQMAQ